MPRHRPSPGPEEPFVLLGTCNGAPYLGEFIESMRGQSYARWKMLVRDDASDDATVATLRELTGEDERFEILPDGLARRGPVGNYATLLRSARDREAAYVFLADQDDVWLPEKIDRQLELMRTTEAETGRDTPVLVYSDLKVVGARLQAIHDSFLRYVRYSPDEVQPLRTLLAHNFIPGCTMLMNRPLLELALPLPSPAPVHDWWIALCAAAAGRLASLPQPTVLYRQHEGNAIGVRAWRTTLNPVKHGWLERWRRGKATFARHVEQADALRRRLQYRQLPCDPQPRDLLDRYCRLLQPSTGLWRRIDGMHRLRIPRTALSRRLLFYACLLTFRRGR